MSEPTDDVRRHIRSVQRRLARFEVAVSRCSTPPRLPNSAAGTQTAYGAVVASPTPLRFVSTPPPTAMTPTSGKGSSSMKGGRLWSDTFGYDHIHAGTGVNSDDDDDDDECRQLTEEIRLTQLRLATAEGKLAALRQHHRDVTLEEASKLKARLRVVQHQREQSRLRRPPFEEEATASKTLDSAAATP